MRAGCSGDGRGGYGLQRMYVCSVCVYGGGKETRKGKKRMRLPNTRFISHMHTHIHIHTHKYTHTHISIYIYALAIGKRRETG